MEMKIEKQAKKLVKSKFAPDCEFSSNGVRWQHIKSNVPSASFLGFLPQNLMKWHWIFRESRFNKTLIYNPTTGEGEKS